LSAEKIFNCLRDKEWHSVAEMSEKTKLEAEKLVEFFKFLAQNGIVQYEDEKHRVKIEPEWSHILPGENAFV